MTFKTFISKFLLLPCSKLYGAATYIRNKMFDWNFIKQQEFNIPIIVVGNLTAGGTGKTPHTEYLMQHLRHSYHIAWLSRGYKRHTKGFIIADRHCTIRDIGDEAFQVYQKFKGEITVAVCEKRAEGIARLLKADPEINLVILDDAFQHRYVKPSLAILITEYGRPVFEDKLLPYGRLRESLRGMNRADMVIVTKCPDTLKPIDFRTYSKSLDLSAFQQLFYTKFEYQNLKPLFPDKVKSIPYLEWMSEKDTLLALAGIGNPRPFIKYVKSFAPRVKVNIFNDHHNFTRKDIELIKQRFESMNGREKYIITTEKDAVRLACNPYFPHELKPYVFYLPIEVKPINETTPEALISSVKKALK